MPAHLSDALLAMYLDGRLDAARVAALEGHAEGCDECRPLWQVMSALRESADPAGPAAPPPLRAAAGRRPSLVLTVLGPARPGRLAPPANGQ